MSIGRIDCGLAFSIIGFWRIAITRKFKGINFMGRSRIQTNNSNLSDANQRHVDQDVLDDIDDLTTVMRDNNNIYSGKRYRLDSKQMQVGQNGFEAGDFKVDIQTVTARKKDSETVAVIYVSEEATNSSLDDFKYAAAQSISTKDIYRVT